MDNFIEMKTFRFYCQKVLPLVYDDSLSYYEVLCKVVDYINKLIENDAEMIRILEIHDGEIEQLKIETKFLYDEFEKVKNGEYVSLYLDSIIKWIDANIQELVARIVKYVTFGLTTDGRFCAYIPESWEFIEFDTIVEQDNELYGHLVLKW